MYLIMFPISILLRSNEDLLYDIYRIWDNDKKKK